MKVIGLIIFMCCQLQVLAQLSVIGSLPQNLSECSGLEFGNGYLIGHNDSGDSTRFFLMNPNGGLIQEWIIDNASNTDWEDIALSKDNRTLYIADVGSNNFWFERPLRQIWKIQLSDDFIPESIDSISFCFEGYDQFSSHAAFDCEALAIRKDSIWMFTKNHVSPYSYIYYLPMNEKDTAHFYDSIYVGYKVTAADYLFDRFAVLSEGNVVILDDSFHVIETIDLPPAKYEALTFKNRKELLLAKDSEGTDLFRLNLNPQNMEYLDYFVTKERELVVLPDNHDISEIRIFTLKGDLIIEQQFTVCPEEFTYSLIDFSGQVLIINVLFRDGNQESVKILVR